MSAHMDTVFQGVWEIKVKREGNLLKAPGIGDDTANLVNLLWSIRALKQVGFKPDNTYYFIGSVEEETGFVGIEAFLNSAEEKFDLVIALDGDLGKVHYGALGFGGRKDYFPRSWGSYHAEPGCAQPKFGRGQGHRADLRDSASCRASGKMDYY